jgi:hypothetical protein
MKAGVTVLQPVLLSAAETEKRWAYQQVVRSESLRVVLMVGTKAFASAGSMALVKECQVEWKWAE